jgi:hypothetical protein
VTKLAQTSTFQQRARIIGWVVIGLVLVILFIFSVIRGLQLVNATPTDHPFELRYLQHPLVATLHMIFSMFFVLFAPLQFNTKFRSRNPSVHRWLGRALLVSALISATYGIAVAIIMPVFGGLAGTTASWFFGPLFIFCAIMAGLRARQKQFTAHREWVIRTFALGLGVGVQRIVLLIMMSVGGHSFYDSFGVALWIGFSLNLLIAETWINLTRAKKIRH